MKLLNFECVCGNKFTLQNESQEVSTRNYCMGSDEYCSCGGFAYIADCPECSSICEADVD